MSLPVRPRTWLVASLAIVISWFLVWRITYTSLPPLEIAFWYWHQPFHLLTAEVAQVKEIGTRKFFVRAGTFRMNEKGIGLIMPQEWSSAADSFDTHLVFNFDYGIVRHFGNLSNETIATAVRDAARRERLLAQRAGHHVAGLQLDFDCPTRLLPKYAQLLRELKSTIRNQTFEISITTLPTWFSSDTMQQVINEVDFYVPQFYEAQTLKTLDHFVTISSLSMVEKGLQAAARRGKAFYVGLPAYGHALMYDEELRLVGMYRDLSASEAARHPSFQLVRAFPADAHGKRATRATYIGEDIFDFIATTSAYDGRHKRYHVVYDLPTPALVAQHLSLVRQRRPRNCRGVILFRFPESNESATVPLPSLAAVIAGRKAAPKLSVHLTTAHAPWELIETGRVAARVPVDLTVTLTNVGNAGTFLSPDAVTLTLSFDQPGLDDIEARDFDSIETFFDDHVGSPNVQNKALLRASPRRSNVIQLRRFHLAVGESAKAGPIHIRADGATKVWGSWSVTGAGGFDVRHGEIKEKKLEAKEGEGK